MITPRFRLSKASREQQLEKELQEVKAELASMKEQARLQISVRERGEVPNPVDMSISSISSRVDSSKMYTYTAISDTLSKLILLG